MTDALVALAAVLIDALVGEPRRGHPLVAFGRFASAVEAHLQADRRMAGVLAWSLAVLPLVALLTIVLHFAPSWLSPALAAGVLYHTLGLRSLGEHATPVARALQAESIDGARSFVARMVSRDVDALDANQVAAAATESVLENGNDAVFGALFWFFVLGAPGALLYRLANTLDAMWGYRTTRYANFGWVAARIDDLLNLVPARLTALSYAALGNTRLALRCWREQAPLWDSPNAGPVMAAGSGALGVRLGGAAPYHGVWEARPELGAGISPDARAIVRALQLVRRAVVLWLLLAFVVAAVVREWPHA
ncbi:MAG: adenosylcobinamide-phosphate synthase CbiB [Dokdonella sp.]